jgi:hypothetical protein
MGEVSSFWNDQQEAAASSPVERQSGVSNRVTRRFRADHRGDDHTAHIAKDVFTSERSRFRTAV